MTNLIEDYLREVSTSLRTDPTRKRQIVSELRTHLAEKVLDMQEEHPERTADEIEREVLREFGNPRDLALSYAPEGNAVLTNSTGDIVLRIGQAAAAVGRGTGKALKWVAICLAGLLVIALGVGAWAFYEVKPYIPSIIASQEPAYQYYERCVQTPCNGSPPADTFYVHPDSRTIRFDLNVYSVHPERDWHREIASGTLRVVVTDPTGAARYDRTFTLNNETGVYQEATWAGEPGNWSIAYEFNDFIGAVDVETYAISHPFSAR